MNKLLSVCIPTYNGAKCIRENLDVMIKQIVENDIKNVEIIVSDNCSTDNIPKIMAEYVEKYPKIITYNRNSENLGYDGNVMKLCEMASGKFIHLFGDDDYFTPNGLLRLLEVLEKYKDLSVLVLSNCYLRQDYYMEIVSRKHLNEEFTIQDKIYINDSDNFIRDIEDRAWPVTNCVFRREYLNQIPNKEHFYKTDWFHLYVLLFIAQKWQNCYSFADKYPIVVDRVGVQTWLNNVDSPRMYFNNLWTYSFANKLGYDKKVFEWYRRKLLSEYIKNIKFRRSRNFFINIMYICKYFRYYKDLPEFYMEFIPLFLFSNLGRELFSITNRYSYKGAIKEKIFTFCFSDTRLYVKRMETISSKIYKEFPPKEMILYDKKGIFVQVVPVKLLAPMIETYKLNPDFRKKFSKFYRYIKIASKQKYMYYSTFINFVNVFNSITLNNKEIKHPCIK